MATRLGVATALVSTGLIGLAAEASAVDPVSAIRANGGVSVSWTDDTTDETSFEVARARNVAGVWSEWAYSSAPADSTTYSDTPVGTGQYAYLVRPLTPGGPGDWGIATIVVSDATAPPATPSAVAVTASFGVATVTWADDATDELGYEIQRARNVAGEWSEWTTFLADIGATSFTDPSTLVDGSYAYVVRAYNDHGASEWVVATVDVVGGSVTPAAPTDLQVTVNGTFVDLTWVDQSADEAYFEILRATFSRGEWGQWSSFLADRDAESFSDNPLDNVVHAYLVRAVNANGASPWVVGTVTVSDATAPPAAPSAPRLSFASGDIFVVWDDNSAPPNSELWFELMRAELVEGSWTNFTSIGVFDVNDNSARDRDIADGTYAYLVRAHNQIGDSAWATSTIVIGPDTPDGPEMFSWGDNATGALGLPAASSVVSTPQAMQSRPSWISVSAGGAHSLGIRNDGTLWAWGANGSGQLGNGTTTPSSVPVQVGTDTNWFKLAAGFGDFSLAIRAGGTLWAWGSNSSGQLGTGGSSSSVPVQVGSYNDWIDVAAGDGFVVGYRADGSLWAWGSNSSGQLGLGDTTNRSTPVRIGTDNDWFRVSAGAGHVLAQRIDGTLWGWGANGEGQVGIGSLVNQLTPAQIGTDNDWADFSAGGAHSVAVKFDGTLWGWGSGAQRQNGLDVVASAAPEQVSSTITDWFTVDAGGAFTLVRRGNGLLYAMGDNSLGQLGSGSTTARPTLDLVGSLPDIGIVSAGGAHAHAIAVGSVG